MPTDWYEASVEERKALYRATRQLVDRGTMTWDQIYERAFGERFHRGTGYESNFGNGKIARYRAAIIFRWLRDEYPELAATVEREITGFYESPDTSGLWERLITEHGVFEAVHVIREQRSPPEAPQPREGAPKHIQQQDQITLARAEIAQDKQSSYRMDMNHPFRFRLASPISGAVLGFQWVRGRWWSIPLGPGTIQSAVREGEQDLPPKQGVSLDGGLLIEGIEAGLHRVVFVIIPDNLAASAVTRYTLDDYVSIGFLDSFAQAILALAPETWRVLRINMMFVTSDSSGGEVA